MALETGKDILRTVRLTPYRKGHGPTYRLITWYTGRCDSRGQSYIGYALYQTALRAKAIPLFTGEDFAGSPMNADDSDATIAALMGFLTLRPGDTDADYFADYTEAQREYCAQHAEALSCEVVCRFGED